MPKENSGLAEVSAPTFTMRFSTGELMGESVLRSRKVLADLRGLFADPEAADAASDAEVYNVQWFAAGRPNAEGGLLWGCTHLHPGRVAGEYFMTHGHFHALATRDEIYLVASGRGLLLRMERSGRTWAEEMGPGTVHYIEGKHGHRVVNTGDEPLVFWASWPGDAGYDYASIVRDGFGIRVFERDGEPVLVARGSHEGVAL